MRSVKSSMKAWKTAARLTLVIVIVVHALEPGAGWAQEPAEARIEEETSKQKKNLSKPGRRSSRRLRHQSRALGLRGTSSLRLLRRARHAGHLGPMAGYRRGCWNKFLDYYAPPDPAAPAEKCALPGGLASAVAMSNRIRRTAAWHQLAASLGELYANPWETPAALFAQELGKIPDDYRCLRRLLLYRRLGPVHGKGTELAGGRWRLFTRTCSTCI